MEMPACHCPQRRAPIAGESHLSWQRAEDGSGSWCAICGLVGTDLVMDHCHATGLERGLLCRSCNVQEGAFSNHFSPAFVSYRKRPPSVICKSADVYFGIREAQPLPWVRKQLGPIPETAALRSEYLVRAQALEPEKVDLFEQHPAEGML